MSVDEDVLAHGCLSSSVLNQGCIRVPSVSSRPACISLRRRSLSCGRAVTIWCLISLGFRCSETRTFALTSRTVSVRATDRTRSGIPSVNLIVKCLSPSSIARCFPFAFSLSILKRGCVGGCAYTRNVNVSASGVGNNNTHDNLVLEQLRRRSLAHHASRRRQVLALFTVTRR